MYIIVYMVYNIYTHINVNYLSIYLHVFSSFFFICLFVMKSAIHTNNYNIIETLVTLYTYFFVQCKIWSVNCAIFNLYVCLSTIFYNLCNVFVFVPHLFALFCGSASTCGKCTTTKLWSTRVGRVNRRAAPETRSVTDPLKCEMRVVPRDYGSNIFSLSKFNY